jgi:hypothetical protein
VFRFKDPVCVPGGSATPCLSPITTIPLLLLLNLSLSSVYIVTAFINRLKWFILNVLPLTLSGVALTLRALGRALVAIYCLSTIKGASPLGSEGSPSCRGAVFGAGRGGVYADPPNARATSLVPKSKIRITPINSCFFCKIGISNTCQTLKFKAVSLFV